MITKNENGLNFDWSGKRVWLNPPYGKEIVPFLEKMRKGIALLPSRTDNSWFHNLVAPRAFGIFFIRGRISFIDKIGRVVGSPAFASMLVAYSMEDVDAILHSGVKGFMMKGMEK